MSFHPVHDADDIADAMRCATHEQLVHSLLARAQRSASLGEAIWREAVGERAVARLGELLEAARDAGRRCEQYADCVATLAPGSTVAEAARQERDRGRLYAESVRVLYRRRCEHLGVTAHA